MLPVLITLTLGLVQQPPPEFSPVLLRPAVVVVHEPEFAEVAEPESEVEAKPVVKERPAPARQVVPKAPKKAKAHLSPKRSSRP